MFAAINSEMRVIAYHEKKSVVKKYLNNLKKSHKDEKFEYQIVKGKIRDIDSEKYLIRFGRTYIQSGYKEILDIEVKPILENEKIAMNMLYEIAKTRELSNKDIKAIARVMRILGEVYDEDISYTPTEEELNAIKERYDKYLNAIKK